MSATSDTQNPLTVPKGISILDRQGTDLSVAEPAVIQKREVLIITGMSGAGRTRAAAALEDLNWYVVDNIPPALLLPLAGMLTSSGEGVHRLAVVVDARSRTFFDGLTAALNELRSHGITYRVVYLEASEAELVRRFEASRRPHPLQGSDTILDGLRREQAKLAPLREQADEIINTTGTSVHDLARHMHSVVANESNRLVSLVITSFGFKYGIPQDADHVLDVRFLKNPYWVDELRKLTGRDKSVSEYVLNQTGTRKFAEMYANLIGATIEGYRRELKPFVNVAIGCTGGRHRSVAVSEFVAAILREQNLAVQVVHRDLGRR